MKLKDFHAVLCTSLFYVLLLSIHNSQFAVSRLFQSWIISKTENLNLYKLLVQVAGQTNNPFKH